MTPDAFPSIFRALAETAVLLIAPDAPRFTILEATDDYLARTLTSRGIIGCPLFEVFPDANPDNTAASGVANLRASLERVLASRAPDRMELQRYDVARPGGGWDVRYWAPLNTPVLDGDGGVRCIQHLVREVTAEVLGREAVERAEQRAARILERMSDAYLLLDREFRYLDINPAAERVAGRPRQELLGRTHWDLFPGTQYTEAGRAYRRVVQDHAAQHVADRYRLDGRDVHIEIDAYPTDEGGVAVFWRDVTLRRLAEAELRDANRRKDEFLATLAHELRNPLAPIRNGLQIVRLSPPGAPAAQRALAIMERQLSHMVRLVDDLLDVSRISRGKIELRPQLLDIRAALEAGVEASRPAIDAAGHRLVLNLPHRPLHVQADPTRLAQVFGNLLHNAAKYTPEAGRIDASAACEDGQVVVRVADNGIGIPPAQLAEVFELFSQLAPTGRTPAQAGLGIGLSICKRLVEMHGGSIEARSEGPGKGTEFAVRLPLADCGEPCSLPVPAETDLQAPGRRVLVVDDNRDAADTLAGMLQLLGHDARCAYSGDEALVLGRDYRPHVVFCDIGMPGMDGYELVRRWRTERGLGRALLVAVTGWGSAEDRQRAHAAGFDRHLAKPVGEAAVLEVLAAPLAEGA